ncbi:MAG: hypothetical protein KME64_11410 [Scytonematopsis contorta HA4267-MV1]|jgi:predicted ATPase|nr:hypothetical protein [Scytonematopsis contorta HA4267-MV1]
MIEKEATKQALIALEYHIKWLEYNLIDEVFLLSQYQYFIDSEDKCTEHYRYAAFQKILKDNQSLDDKAINRYIQLAELDNDKYMANSALMNLFMWECLNDAQYTALVNHSAFSHKVFQKYHQNKILIQTIDSVNLISDEVLEFYIQNYESIIQEYLLNK